MKEVAGQPGQPCKRQQESDVRPDDRPHGPPDCFKHRLRAGRKNAVAAFHVRQPQAETEIEEPPCDPPGMGKGVDAGRQEQERQVDVQAGDPAEELGVPVVHRAGGFAAEALVAKRDCQNGGPVGPESADLPAMRPGDSGSAQEFAVDQVAALRAAVAGEGPEVVPAVRAEGVALNRRQRRLGSGLVGVVH